jgi:antirestriction protein ArdC
MDIYQLVTDRILQQLAAGTVPWRKTWTVGLPQSLTTGKEYRGINILLLGMTAHSSRYWITYREAQRRGGHVRKGERATPVIFWKWRTPEEIQQQLQKTGKDSVAPCVPFVSAVFNLDQVEGIARPEDDAAPDTATALDVAGQLFDAMPDKPEIEHARNFQPAYCQVTDRVLMPHLGQFETAPEYYGTLFHELVHATGHPKRLKRFAETAGNPTERYSFEELVAEFGAAFLCGIAGIQNRETEALQAGYIASWSRVFEKDSRMLLRAASAAQRAVDYIRGRNLEATQVQSANVEVLQLAQV